jgi:hypothetical protein
LIGSVPQGKGVLVARIVVTEAFDGDVPQLSIGPSGALEQVMPRASSNPAEVATYETTPALVFGADTDVFLSITPGAGASHGKGIAQLELEP